MRTLAITGMVTASIILVITAGSVMRATPPVGADVSRDALEGHDRHGPGFGGNQGLLRGDHVHYYAALEHLGVSSLHGKSAG